MPKEYIYYDVRTEIETRPSLYTDYPNNTKFISYHIYASDVMNVVGREIYSVPDYMSDVGGLFFGLLRLFTVFLFPFRKLQLNAMLANKLFMVESKFLDS